MFDSFKDGTNKKKSSPSRDPRMPRGAVPTKSLLKSVDWLNEIRNRRLEYPTDHEVMAGPFFRDLAPYRAKISPPHELGTTLVIHGRVWSYDWKTALQATIDVWHADAAGHYDNEKPFRSKDSFSFINRARVRCAEDGYYEIETVHPQAYQRGSTWHAPHIHFRVIYPGFETCLTQLLFKGDDYVETDPFRAYSTIIELKKTTYNGQKCEEGEFDIVLVKSPESDKPGSKGP